MLLQAISSGHLHAGLVLIQDPPQQIRTGKKIRDWDIHLPGVPCWFAEVAILSHRSLRGIQLVPWEDGRTVAVSYSTHSGKVLVISSYIQPITGLGILSLKHFLNQFGNLYDQIVLAMDCNGHSKWWSPAHIKTNRQGHVIEQFILEYSFQVANNKNSIPTFYSSTGQGYWVDITLFSPSTQIDHWACNLEHASVSDHAVLTYRLADPLPSSLELRRNWRAAPWGNINMHMQERLQSLHGQHNVINTCAGLDEYVGKFRNICQQVAEDFVPMKHVSENSKGWWTPHLQRLKQTLKNALRMRNRYWARHNQSAPGSITQRLRYARSSMKKAVAEAKQRQWREFAQDTSNTQLWDRFNRVCRPKATLNYSVITDSSGNQLNDPTHIAKAMAVKFFPKDDLPFTPSQQMILDIHATRLTAGPTDFRGEMPDITSQEIQSALAASRQFSAAGSDGIPAIFYSKTWQTVSVHLLMIFNLSLTLSHLPAYWKEARIIPVPKGSARTSSLKDMRPISLIPYISKLMESVLTRRLNYWAQIHAPICEKQHGFVQGRSTESALYTLTHKMMVGIGKGQTGAILAIDFQSAFDRVWDVGVLDKLWRKGLPAYLWWWLRDFFSDRKAIIQIKEHVHTFSLCSGTPQGSPLSPSIFLHFIEDLLDSPALPDIMAYADDCMLARMGTWSEVQASLQTQLNYIWDWAIINRMVISLQKCQAMLIKKNPTLTVRVDPFSLGTVLLPWQPQMKILGVFFDPALSFSRHVDYLVGKLSTTMKQIYRLTGRFWGLQTNTLLRLFHAILVPQLFYGVGSWGARLSPKCVQRLHSLFRRMQLQLSGCLHTTAHTSLSYLTGMLPLRDWIHLQFFAAMFRLHETGHLHTDTAARHPILGAWCILVGKILRADGLRGHTIPTNRKATLSSAPWLPVLPACVGYRLLPASTPATRQFSYRTIYMHIEVQEGSNDIHRGTFGWRLTWGAMNAGDTCCLRGLYSRLLLEMDAALRGFSQLLDWYTACATPPNKIIVVGLSSQCLTQMWSRKSGYSQFNTLRSLIRRLAPIPLTFHGGSVHARSLLIMQQLARQVGDCPQTSMLQLDSGWDAKLTKDALEKVLTLSWTNSLETAATGGGVRSLGIDFTAHYMLTSHMPRYASTLVNQFISNHYPSRPYLVRFRVSSPTSTPLGVPCLCGAQRESRTHLVFYCHLLEQPRRELAASIATSESNEQEGLTWEHILGSKRGLSALGTYLKNVKRVWGAHGRAWGPHE